MRTSGLNVRLINGQCWNGHGFETTTITIKAGRFAADLNMSVPTIDLEGARILPAIINGHEHLELNHYPRTRFQDQYGNAKAWASDMQSRLDTHPFKELRGYRYEDKAHLGLLKNLLSGVHYVVQHGMPHPYLFRRDHPVTVIPSYQWAHSLYLSHADEIRLAHQKATSSARFYIHLAEGTDAAAQAEYDELAAMGCVSDRTVFVHAVGMSAEQIRDARQRGARVVTCPSTNQYLLGKSTDATLWGDALTLGTDSRLTADGDFWHEAQAFTNLWGEARLWRTLHNATTALGLPIASPFLFNTPASLTVMGSPLARSHIQLVIHNGAALWGTPRAMQPLVSDTLSLTLDEQPFLLNKSLARWIVGGKLKETGLTVNQPAVRRWW